MIDRSEQVYQEMLFDLLQCLNKGLPSIVEIECGFRTAERYRRLVQEELDRYQFIDKTEEIRFYKEIRPRFIGESAYYRLLNYGQNFCPVHADPHEQRTFWMRQVNRLEQYKIKFSEFYCYYNSGKTDLDELYYTSPWPGRFDERCGELMARERYASYACEQMKRLKMG